MFISQLFSRRLVFCALLTFVFNAPLYAGDTPENHSAKVFHFGVLMASDVRLPRVEGLQQGMEQHGAPYGIHYDYRLFDAQGKREQLLPLAQQLIAQKPDIAIACGGIEADALRQATLDTNIPVVFLYSASSAERGLVASFSHPGGNITGIDGNDTALTEKRLWYLHKMLPEVKRITCFNIPSIGSSAQAAKVATSAGTRMGLEINIINVATIDELPGNIEAMLQQNSSEAILLLPCAPIYQILGSVIEPVATRKGIPIFGAMDGNLAQGACASFGSIEKNCGKQAARLVIKILHGSNPANLPVETPEDFELVLNRTMIERLHLKIPQQLWRLADRIETAAPAPQL